MKKYYKILSLAFYLQILIGISTFLYAQFSKNAPVYINDKFGDLYVSGFSILLISVFFIFFIISAAIFLHYLFVDRKNISLLNLSFFIAISALWSLFATKIPLVWFENTLGFSTILNASFFLLPLPLLLYMAELCESGKKGFYIICSVILIFNLIACICIMANILLFPYFLISFHCILLFTILFSLYSLIMDFLKRKNENNKILILGLTVFIVGGLINIIGYYSMPNRSYSDYMTIGLIFFIVVLVIVTVKNIINELVIVRNFENIASEIPTGIFKAKVDDNMTLVYANKFYYSLLGYANESVHNLTSACLPFIDSKKLLQSCHNQMSMGNTKFEIEALAKSRNGEIINVLLTLHHLVDSNEIVGTILNITNRKEYETKLIIAEEEYQIVMQHISHVICRYDIQSQMLYLPQNFANRYNLPKSCYYISNLDNCNQLISEISLPDFRKLYGDIKQGVKTGSTIIKMHELNGNDSWWDITFDTIFDNNNIPNLTVIICQDITELREKELAYIKWTQEIANISQQKMYLIEWNLSKDVFDCEKGDISQSKLTYDDDINFNDKMQNYAQNNIFAPDIPVFLHKTNREFLIEQYNKGSDSYIFEYREKQKDDTINWMSLSVQLVPYPHTREIKGYFIFRDVDGEKRETLDLKYRANKDSLTGLLNRNSFIDKFLNALLENKADTSNKHLLVIDIDNFKTVNDTHGHFIGDKFLVKIASILISLQKKGDYVGRLGGDEFLMLLKNEKTSADLTATLNEILTMLNVEIDGIKITCSIGVATFPDNGKSFGVLYEKADIALYKAKKNGRNQYCLVDNSFVQTDEKL